MDTKLVNGGDPITANGTYVIPADPGDTLLVDCDGTPDGASTSLKWRSTAGNDHAVKDSAGNGIGGDDTDPEWVGRVDITKAGVAVIEVTDAGDDTSLRVGWVSVARGPTSTGAGALAAAE